MEAGRSPFLLTCDHYGRLIPRMLGDLGLPESELVRHIAWDIGIAGVAEALSKHLDAHLIVQRYSRLVIDCNRPPHVASSIRASARPPRSRATRAFRGKSGDAAGADLRSLSPAHRRDHRPARDCGPADGAGVAAQLYACLCRIAAPGISARSITATPICPAAAKAVARGGRSRGRRQRAYCGQRRDRLHHPRAWRGARPDEYGNRNPPGSDLRCRRREKRGPTGWRGFFAEIEPMLRAGNCCRRTLEGPVERFAENIPRRQSQSLRQSA